MRTQYGALAIKAASSHGHEDDSLAAVERETARIQTGINEIAQAHDARIRELEQKLCRSPGPGGDDFGLSPFTHVHEHPGFVAFAKNGAINSGRIALDGVSLSALSKAVLVTGPAPAGFPAEAARLPVARVTPRRMRLYDVLRRMPVSVGTVEYVQLSAAADSAGVQATEGAAKKEATVTTALKTATIATVATWLQVSRQALVDNASLQLALSDAFRTRALEKAHDLLIAGAGGADVISGLATEATAFVPTATADVDIVSEAQATLDEAGYTAGVVLLNPIRWHRMRSARATGGEYVAGSWNAPASPNVWGVPVVTASAVGINEALVIDPQCAVLLDREQATVLISTEDRDNFVKNLATILAELRLGLAVTDKGGVLKMTLPA